MTSVKKKQSKRIKNSDIFTKNCLNRNINLPFESIGENIKENLLKKLQEDLEGKCAKEGFIKKIQLIYYYTHLVLLKVIILFSMLFLNVIYVVL